MHPVFGSVNTPEELHCGSSGNKSKNRSSLDLNGFTDFFFFFFFFLKWRKYKGENSSIS